MEIEVLFWTLLLLPAAGGAVSASLGNRRLMLGVLIASVAAWSAAVAAACARVGELGSVEAASSWLRLDALSAWHLAVMALICLLSTCYARVYFGEEMDRGGFPARQARQFCLLWGGTLSAMTLVLVSNNLGIMWVGVESTTLLTAFLICLHLSKPSIEATWKYILICSVGVGFAFMGTLLMAVSAKGTALSPEEALLWTRLWEGAAKLDPVWAKAGFIFLAVGYGTKAGLAPMHNWLPDAHSQAPAPVSAIFSGFMLNAALYCVMRHVPVLEAVPGCEGFATGLLRGFGILSILVAAVFIVFQHDLKRLLAYHSVEHMGIIALGLGLGGLGTFAALFHTVNHSVCKTLSFFAAGRLGQMYGTHDMAGMRGAMKVSPLWGAGIFGSILALIGVAPFALFMSEFLLLKAAIDSGSAVSAVLFLAGGAVVFMAALGHAIPLAWGGGEQRAGRRAGVLEAVLVVLPMAILLGLGIWMPDMLEAAISQAAGVVGGVRAFGLAGAQGGAR